LIREFAMKRYAWLIGLFLVVLFADTSIAQANLENPVSKLVIDAASIDQDWNMEILTFHDEDWSGVPDATEVYVDASGIVTYEGGEQEWVNDLEVRARVNVPRGIPLSIHSIEEKLEIYGCRNVTYTLPAEGKWVLYVPCHVRWYMVIPWVMNWG
jgi:hypothetical protein